MMKTRHLTVREYSYIGVSENPYEDEDGNIFVLKTTFDQLENFVLTSNPEQTSDFLKLSTRSGKKVIVAQNYVGVIETKDGTSIEILPKLHNTCNADARKMLLGMLRHLKDAPFKKMDFASLKTEKMPLYEIFISMFLEEISMLIKKGIKSDYISTSENMPFLKGKVNWPQHLKRNIVHRERFFVDYESYSADRAENRLIKSTLVLLNNKTCLLNNQKLINEFLFVFNDICESTNVKFDFSKVKSDRTMADYEKVLRWCKIFLLNESFTNFRGNSIAFALLFPMERIFEDYVAAFLKKNLSEYTVHCQKSEYWLVDNHIDSGKFRLKPDIVIEMGNNQKVVLDTKWKVIDQLASNKNYMISQADMYQLYAYGTKYGHNNTQRIVLILIYPYTDKFSEPLKPFNYYLEAAAHGKLCLYVIPFDIKKSFGKEKDTLEILLCLNKQIKLIN